DRPEDSLFQRGELPGRMDARDKPERCCPFSRNDLNQTKLMEGIEGGTNDLVLATSEIGELIRVERARHQRRLAQAALAGPADDAICRRDNGGSDHAVDPKKLWSRNFSDRVMGQPIHDWASARRRFTPNLAYAARRQQT